MSDFIQNGPITTLHDLGSARRERLESLLRKATRDYRIGLVIPVTGPDMHATPFSQIIRQLEAVDYIADIVVVLGVAPEEQDYRDARAFVDRLGDRAQILWTDGQRVQRLYEQLRQAGLNLSAPGKGLAVWTAFGYLLADHRLAAFVLQDSDIVNYDRLMLARLCLPMAHPSLDFEFCKAYYSRWTDRMHGRVVRLLITPLLSALIKTLGPHRFLTYLNSFRYPLAGEFAVSRNLARSNRIPGDWGLEIGTLAETYRNTSLKRVCQVDLCPQYEHKHQPVSLEDPGRGLMKMAADILTTIFRTIASMGQSFEAGYFGTLRSAYLRSAQDLIRQYHADSVLNALHYDRHVEEKTVEGFAQQIVAAGEIFRNDPLGGGEMPNWSRVLAALPELPAALREAAAEDARELC